MNNDERQLVQVKMIKESPLTPDYTKVWIYRNSVYAYPWFTEVRKILDDPAYEPWFLQFSGSGPWASPACDKNYDPPLCTKYFHTQMDTPLPSTRWGKEGHPIGGYGQCFPKDNKSGCDCGTKPCGFCECCNSHFLRVTCHFDQADTSVWHADVFNHSSTAVIKGETFQEWFLDDYMFNQVGSSSLVNGFYWDDTWYPGGVGDDPEHGMITDMGLTKADLLQLTASYDATMLKLVNRTIAAGKFAWQLMGASRMSAGLTTPPNSQRPSCLPSLLMS
jgi:hypothetical protein